jgi:hypothetical protein
MVVEENNNNVAEDPKVREHIDSIGRLEVFLHEKEQEIESIKKAAREKRTGQV